MHNFDAEGSAVSGTTVWFTGLPSAGKTTLARACQAELAPTGSPPSVVLDGDEMRRHLGGDLGFSATDRVESVRRIGYVASLLAGAGVTVFAAVIAPYRHARDIVRDQHHNVGARYLEVHVATPLAECIRRDVKGLYRRQRDGDLTGLTGVDDPYEAPINPDLVLDTSGADIRECVQSVRRLLAVPAAR